MDFLQDMPLTENFITLAVALILVYFILKLTVKIALKLLLLAIVLLIGGYFLYQYNVVELPDNVNKTMEKIDQKIEEHKKK